MIEFWKGLAKTARIGLIAGVIVVLAFTALGVWWALRTDYQVLFADLSPQDASAMTAELERQKIPYRLAGEGTTILVDRGIVHATRLKVMGRDLPLKGAVGLEVFNNSDFGMTEFAQKVNFQRALQGELTRTILTLEEVRDARVHLALPEQGLFRQATSRPKAAITLTLRPQRTLRAEQISGIQRLVASSVPGMTAQEVTIVDNRGVALTRSGVDGELSAGGASRLELKREMESYLARKVSGILERSFGPDQAAASVDVTLDMDHVKVTTEDVMPVLAGQARQSPTGVVVRERESVREVAPPLDVRVSDSLAARPSGSSQREVDYQVGRRVEQVISQPGAIRQIQVVAVIPRRLDSMAEQDLRSALGAAAGIAAERGDSVVLQVATASALADPDLLPDGPPGVEESANGSAPRPPATGPSGTIAIPDSARMLILVVAGLALLFGGGVLVGRRSSASAPLTARQREAALQQVKGWLRGQAEPGHGAASRRGEP